MFPRLLHFQCIVDPRGNLTVVEGGSSVPFDIRRMFFIYGVPVGAERGGHAHRLDQEVLIVPQGSMRVSVDNGRGDTEVFTLDDPNTGLYIPPGHWRMLSHFTPGTVCLVASSTHYDPDDYFYDYDEFVAYAHTLQ